MSKIVIELQQEALKRDSDIMSLLRKAYLVAKKLKLQEFEKWISNELNGYGDKDEIPEYRLLRGEIKAWNPYYGWIPVVLINENISTSINNENNNENISTHMAADSIASLLNIYENSAKKKAILQFGAEFNSLLSQWVSFNTKFALEIGTNQIYNIIERVRNIILDWSITLEENGILGDGLQFNETEKDIANSTPTINTYINNFFGSVSETQIQQDSTKSLQNKN